MEMKLNANVVSMVIAAFGMICWIIGLAGVGSLHSECARLATGSACTKAMQHSWWSIWFEAFLLIAVLAMGVMGKLAAHKLTLLALLTASLALTMDQAAGATQVEAPSAKSQYDAAAAGFVLLSLVNILLLVVLGSFMGEAAAGGDATAEVTFKKAAALPAAMPAAAGSPV